MKSTVFVSVIGLFICFVIEFTRANLIYQCREFDPQTPHDCGLNTGSSGHNWTIHPTKTLPKIYSRVVDIRYVLYMDSTNSRVPEYRLTGPSHWQMSTVQQLCIQYAILTSDNCADTEQSGQVCTANMTLRSSVNGLVLKPEREFNFEDHGWVISNFQFNLASRRPENKANLQLLLHGYIQGNKAQLPSDQPPYIALMYINVFNGTCTERIGTRKPFWITVMVIFTLITGYTFVHIAIQHILREHKKRAELSEKAIDIDGGGH